MDAFIVGVFAALALASFAMRAVQQTRRIDLDVEAFNAARPREADDA